jgi:cobalt-zinc-cadmium efflux system outer membrane protein
MRSIRAGAFTATRLCSSALLLALCLEPSAFAQAEASSRGLTEDQFLDLVLAQSLDARVAEREAALGRAEAVGAGAWPNPSLAWNREASGEDAAGTQDIIAASIPLVLSGRLGLAQDAADERARAGQARAEGTRALLRLEAVRAYDAILVAQQRRAVLEASIAALTVLTDAVAAREQAGAASGYDRVRIEVERALVATALRGILGEEQHARADALRLLGPTTRELPPLSARVGVRNIPDLNALMSKLGVRRSDLRALELDGTAAEIERRAAARSWVPEPTISGGVQLLDVGGSRREAGYVVGVTLPLPLFDRRQDQQARSAAQRELASTRHVALLHAARGQLAAAFADLTSRREQLEHHRREVITRTQELRTIAAAAYRGGAAELLVLVDAERAAREARLTEIELLAAIGRAESNLLFIAGAYDKPREGVAR